MLPTSSIYQALRLPVRYLGEDYDKSDMPKTRIKSLTDSIYKAPDKGQLLISGSAGPIINQLWEMGRKTFGISFTEYYESQFADDTDSRLPSKVSSIVVHGIGNERAKNFEFSTRLLVSLLDYYSSREVLVILETPLTITDFTQRYGIEIPTTLKLRMKKEASWL